jgi:protein involved in polysaccharide export with SLBB domain
MSLVVRPRRAAFALAVLAAAAACSSTPEAPEMPAVQTVTVSGAVRKPGRVALPSPPAVVSLVDAIDACGNFLEEADPARIRVTRLSSTGRIQVGVSYYDVTEGRRPDFRLRPDDVIFVPKRGTR